LVPANVREYRPVFTEIIIIIYSNLGNFDKFLTNLKFCLKNLGRYLDWYFFENDKKKKNPWLLLLEEEGDLEVPGHVTLVASGGA
jgi:hypothetical protein